MNQTEHISYHGTMAENDYLDLVLRIQKAMVIEPFQPSVIDVVKLLSDWRDWSRENERLRAALQEIVDRYDSLSMSPAREIALAALGSDRQG
jgi:hypothetical protein